MIGIVVKRFHKNIALIAMEWPHRPILPGNRPDLLSFLADAAPLVLLDHDPEIDKATCGKSLRLRPKTNPFFGF